MAGSPGSSPITTERFPTYDTPDFCDAEPNFEKTAENDKLDLGWHVGTLSDGRPFRLDCWCVDQTTNVTVFVSRAGIDGYSKDDFAELLEREGLIRYVTPRRSSSPVRVVDHVGAEMWSINVMLDAEDACFAELTTPLCSYTRQEPPCNRVRWADVRDYVDDLFDVWNGGGGLKWARNAWRKVTVAGLTRFETDGERWRVLVRLLCLAAFYRSWCGAAWEESSATLNDLASVLEFSPFRLGQLVGPDWMPEYVEGDDDPIEEALRELVGEEYGAIVNIMTADGDAKLFTTLWLSRDADAPDEPSSEQIGEAVNTDVSDEKMAGYAWVAEGCPLRLD